MKKPVVRLQSEGTQAALDALNDLRGQALADADYNRKLGVLRWTVQREILAAYGQAMWVYSGHWEALDRRHREQSTAFELREGSVVGRFVNFASTVPTESFAAALGHFREGLLSTETRQNALAAIQKRERDELALRQQRYRDGLCKPHQQVLDVLSQTEGHEINKPEHSDELTNFQGIMLRRARASIAKEIARSLHPDTPTQDGRSADHQRTAAEQRNNELDME